MRVSDAAENESASVLAYAGAVAAAVEAGQISTDVGAGLVGARLTAAKQAMVVLSDAAIARALGTSPLGLTFPASTVALRLTESARTVLENGTGADTLARSEISAEARTATRRAISGHGVTELRWVADADACEACREQHGRVFPVTEPLEHHPGCVCAFEPITEETP